jgi:hypothetical protein
MNLAMLNATAMRSQAMNTCNNTMGNGSIGLDPTMLPSLEHVTKLLQQHTWPGNLQAASRMSNLQTIQKPGSFAPAGISQQLSQNAMHGLMPQNVFSYTVPNDEDKKRVS